MLTKENILIVLLSFTVISPAVAKVYKWTDANGAVHYTSTPPPTNLKVKKKEELKIYKTAKSSLTYKPKNQSPLITTQKKIKNKKLKNKAQKSGLKKNSSDKKECENTSLAEREAMMRDIEKNGKKALAKGLETKESYDKTREMFRRAIIDCE